MAKHIFTRSIASCIALLAILIPVGVKANTPTDVSFNVSLDSLVILMGKQTVMHFQIVQDKNTQGAILIDNPQFIAPNVEIAGVAIEGDTTDLGNNRIEIHKALIVQAFDSGIWEIPAAKYMIGRDTIFSNELALKVVPVNVDSLATVHDFKPTETVPFNLFDFIPDFLYYYGLYILLAILLIIAGICYYYTRRKKEHNEDIPDKPLLPPYEEAIEALEALKSSKLWQAGQNKEYYTQLTDILRRYIERRFGVNAVEMTTSQIIQTLKHNEETRMVNGQLNQILEVADFVKFANMQTLPDDNEIAWNRAEKFVTETKPAPEPEAETTDNSTSNGKTDDKLTTDKEEQL